MAEMWCGRRNEIGVASTFPGPDHWRDERDSYSIGPTCSFCGSISPDKLFELIEAGATIGPTDKSYKVYVETVNRMPDQLRVDSASNENEKPPYMSGQGEWKRTDELTAQERQIAGSWLRSDHWQWLHFGPAGPTSHGKFYFQHLDEAGQQRFIDLVNDKKINFGEPGYLYARPYFTRPAEAVDA